MKDLKKEYWKWYLGHKHVFESFEKKTMDLINKGWTHYSSKTILENMRYENDVQKDEADRWKINNSYTAYFARHFIYLHPKHKNFFEIRELISVQNGI